MLDVHNGHGGDPPEKGVTKVARDIKIKKFRIDCPYCQPGYVDNESFSLGSDPRGQAVTCDNPDCKEFFRVSQIPRFTF